ncbi:hypothetical protein QFC19_006491 [Naganishia cerealis]|uniref:Uncharacterized protein n=1 Tax=Naganishia cerealis TaxID=610337 RepID=A0ACC2VGT9_9TREE|nr:hypothetical protein QFC19_006491 [Naganishia cerealis]
MACLGDSSKICGQAWRLNVYSLGGSPAAVPSTTTSTSKSSTPTTSPAAATSAVATGTAAALGCYIDSGSARVLPDASSSSGSMTPSLCQSTCRSKGYNYAGELDQSRNHFVYIANDGAVPLVTRSGVWPRMLVLLRRAACQRQDLGLGLFHGVCWRCEKYLRECLEVERLAVERYSNLNARRDIHCSKHDNHGGRVKYASTGHDELHDNDGFILNFGLDPWQPARIADAYAVAAQLGSSFKLFLSPDMDVIECVSTANLGLIQNYITTYANHPAAAKYGGKSLLTTFAGQNCRFGQSSANSGWNLAMAGLRNSTYFIPAFTDNGDGFGKLPTYDIDGFVNWGAAWPSSTADVTTADDQGMVSLLGTKRLMATVSPLFFTHFPWKNWLYRSDDFMMSQKLEQLLCMRNQLDQIEIISWNDYGEAHYVGDIGGDQPPESKLYTLGIPHTGILPLIKYYATAWKTGSWPKITSDQVFVMARPHSAMATATSDSVGAPTGRDSTQDHFYAQVHLTAPATVYLKTDSKSTTFNGVAGVNRFEAPLENGSGVEVLVGRNGATTASVVIPNYTFSSSTARYNFNYYIASSD